MRIIYYLLISGLMLGMASCKTQRAIYNYLEDFTDTTTQKSYFITEPLIQKNDQLSINITSASLDEKVNALYNMSIQSMGGQQQAMGFGYLVNQRGFVEIPRIGSIHAEGLTKEQLADSIKLKLRGVLTEPSVIIRFTNFRIIVIGEVGNPGVHSIPVENLTLLEALAMAGDISEFGKRKEVKILREHNGKRQLGIIDVTTSRMFESPYYQLQQNDVVMVEQTRYKVRQTEQSRVTQQIGFTLSIITTLAFLINVIK
jgi:polysaccharide export outer membrane protein